MPGLLIHDLRRSAVRNMEQAGVSRSVAMKLTGHKTEAVYRRYAIVSSADLEEAAKRLAAASATDPTKAPRVRLALAAEAISDVRGGAQMLASGGELHRAEVVPDHGAVGSLGNPNHCNTSPATAAKQPSVTFRSRSARSAGKGASQVTEKMVGRDGIEPPTPGFSDLGGIGTIGHYPAALGSIPGFCRLFRLRLFRWRHVASDGSDTTLTQSGAPVTPRDGSRRATLGVSTP
jgi:hypothetical protein